MCDIDCLQNVARYLDLSPGVISYNKQNVITRTLPTGVELSGFATIVQSLLREANRTSKSNSKEFEKDCLISQWFDFAVLFVGPAGNDKHVAGPLLKELNSYLNTRTYLVGEELTMADVVTFYVLNQTMKNLLAIDKDSHLNVSRWYDHLQQDIRIRQGIDLVNFTTIHLLGWATGRHM